MTDPIEGILEQRGGSYGDFGEMAQIAQTLKAAMSSTPNWERLSHDKREALEMVALKIGRILNGDPDYLDNWVDIIGYAQLVTQRLTKPEAA